MVVRPMRAEDLAFAAECTHREGWTSETRTEFDAFFAYDPAGCFLLETDARSIGICIATPYRSNGFIGEVIVDPAYRGRGGGALLMQHAIEYLQGRGIRAIFLDGVPRAVPLYERLGFRKRCRSLRLCGQLPGAPPEGVRRMRTADLKSVLAMDRTAFGEDRGFFLRRRLANYPDLCLVQETGYVMGRPADNVAVAGPLVLRTGDADPLPLLQGLAAAGGTSELVVMVLESHDLAVATLRKHGFLPRPDAPWRMVLSENTSAMNLGASPLAWAPGSPAKG